MIKEAVTRIFMLTSSLLIASLMISLAWLFALLFALQLVYTDLRSTIAVCHLSYVGQRLAVQISLGNAVQQPGTVKRLSLGQICGRSLPLVLAWCALSAKQNLLPPAVSDGRPRRDAQSRDDCHVAQAHLSQTFPRWDSVIVVTARPPDGRRSSSSSGGEDPPTNFTPRLQPSAAKSSWNDRVRDPAPHATKDGNHGQHRHAAGLRR